MELGLESLNLADGVHDVDVIALDLAVIDVLEGRIGALAADNDLLCGRSLDRKGNAESRQHG